LVRNAADIVKEAANGGTSDTVKIFVSYGLASSAQVEILTAASSAATTRIDLTGNGFSQAITGNAGNNSIEGKGGADLLRGLKGDDRFVFAAGDIPAGSGRDTISDFEDVGDNDTIDLSAFAGTLSFVGASSFSAANQVRAIQSGTRVLIQINSDANLGADSEILLLNTTLGQIDLSDFML
jgi:serralysin